MKHRSGNVSPTEIPNNRNIWKQTRWKIQQICERLNREKRLWHAAERRTKCKDSSKSRNTSGETPFTWGQSCQQEQQQLRTHDGSDESVRKKPVKPGTIRREKHRCVKSRPSKSLYNCTPLHSSDRFSYLLHFRLAPNNQSAVPPAESCQGDNDITAQQTCLFIYFLISSQSQKKF